MDPLTLSLLIARILLINTKNLMQAVDKAKANDGKITSDEFPDIIFETAIKSLVGNKQHWEIPVFWNAYSMCLTCLEILSLRLKNL